MTGDKTRFKEHLALLRQAGRGLGGDIDVELKGLERDIERFPSAVGRDAEILAEDIEYGLLKAALKINKGMKAIPGEVARGARALGRDAVRLKRETAQEIRRARKTVKKDVKSSFTKAAGIKTGSISEWERPTKKNKG